MRLPPSFSTPSDGRVLDVLQSLKGNFLSQGALFSPLPVGELSIDALTGLLSARDRYKKSLFGDAIRLLENNPALADLPPCQTAKTSSGCAR